MSSITTNYPSVEAPLLQTWFAGKSKSFTEFGVTCTVTCTESTDQIPGFSLEWNGTCNIFGHEFNQNFIQPPTERAISEFIAISLLKVLAVGAATLTEVKS